jgi:hypothetical protein
VKAFACYVAAALMVFSMACNKSTEPRQNWAPLSFEELSKETIPPCLYFPGRSIQAVVANNEDYEIIRREHPPQGEYVDFEADGVQRTFEFPYQPLDVCHDGKIDPYDIVIYVMYKLLYANLDGKLFLVYSNPIRVRCDSLPVFSISPPYPFERNVHYTQVFTVDSLSGAVTFGTPPQQGSKVSICAMKLYDVYDGRECSMEYWDFASRIIIGKSITGNGCLLGFRKELYLDRDKRQLIYVSRRIELRMPACPEIFKQYTSWIAVDRPPEGYEVVFVEQKSY